MADSQLIAGVGDEVVFFGAFLILSVCMLVFFSRIRGSNQQRDQGNYIICMAIRQCCINGKGLGTYGKCINVPTGGGVAFKILPLIGRCGL